MFCVPFLSFLAPIKSSKIAWKRFIVSLVFLKGQSNSYWYIGWNELRQWLINPKSSTVNLNAGVQRYSLECFGTNVIIRNVMSSSRWWSCTVCWNWSHLRSRCVCLAFPCFIRTESITHILNMKKQNTVIYLFVVVYIYHNNAGYLWQAQTNNDNEDGGILTWTLSWQFCLSPGTFAKVWTKWSAGLKLTGQGYPKLWV